MIAGLLVVVVIVGVVLAARHRNAPVVPTMANAGNAVPGVADDPSATAPAGRAPDISNLTPKEQYTRLVDRISQAMDKGDTATVITFTPMALGAYANLPAGDRDIDARFHAAILEAQVGMFDNAKALADTIMQLAPDDLFGYYIRAAVAGFAGDSAAAKSARAGFRSHFDAEMKKQRPEYTEHLALLQQYRQGDGAH